MRIRFTDGGPEAQRKTVTSYNPSRGSVVELGCGPPKTVSSAPLLEPAFVSFM
jgi:hypothetical protein